jgi:hypothetical protein
MTVYPNGSVAHTESNLARETRQKRARRIIVMVRRLSGSLLLILLLLGLLYAQPAWAEGHDENSANVMVRVSPLALLVQNKVIIKVGEYTCDYANGIEPASVCWKLPPGDYEVSATSDGYIVSPPHYHLDLSSNSNNTLYFRLYQNNYQLYMPSMQVQP